MKSCGGWTRLSWRTGPGNQRPGGYEFQSWFRWISHKARVFNLLSDLRCQWTRRTATGWIRNLLLARKEHTFLLYYYSWTFFYNIPSNSQCQGKSFILNRTRSMNSSGSMGKWLIARNCQLDAKIYDKINQNICSLLKSVLNDRFER
jgi:hypothetical protein